MQEQKEALESIKLIKSTLLESQNGIFIPWCTFVLIGVVSTLLFIFIPYLYKSLDSFGYVSLLSALLVVTLSLFNYISAKKEIERQNNLLERTYSKNQKFIMRIYLISIICGIGFDMFFSIVGLWSSIYFSWMIFLGFPAVIYGFFSKNYIQNFGYGLIILGVLGFITQFINHFFTLNISEYTLFEIARILAVLSVGVGYIVIGFKNKRECDCV